MALFCNRCGQGCLFPNDAVKLGWVFTEDANPLDVIDPSGTVTTVLCPDCVADARSRESG